LADSSLHREDFAAVVQRKDFAMLALKKAWDFSMLVHLPFVGGQVAASKAFAHEDEEPNLDLISSVRSQRCSATCAQSGEILFGSGAPTPPSSLPGAH
jgi:hypothetical protein